MKELTRWGAGIVGDKRPDHTLEFRHNVATLGKLELFERTVDCEDSGVLSMLGVGGVWTWGDVRRRGVASFLIGQARSLAVDWKKDGVILFSLENTVPMYEALGLRLHHGKVEVQQPTGFVKVPEAVRVLHVGSSYIGEHEDLKILGLPW